MLKNRTLLFAAIAVLAVIAYGLVSKTEPPATKPAPTATASVELPHKKKSHVRSIDHLSGSAPLQGDGFLENGQAFYFRARHEAWSLGTGATLEEASGSEPKWVWREPWGNKRYAASYMDEEEGRLIIESCADMIADSVEPPHEYEGVPMEAVMARELAWSTAENLMLYADAGRPTLEDITESRLVFLKRYPDAGDLFEAEVATIPARAKGEIVQLASLTDAGSAERVGRRWNALLDRSAPSQRKERRNNARAWVKGWAASAEVYAAFEKVLSN